MYNTFRVCCSLPSSQDIGIISQCSDLLVQFQSRADAWGVLQQLPLFGSYKGLELNYAEFDFAEPPCDQGLSALHDRRRFPSELGCYAMAMLRSLGHLFEDKYLFENNVASRFISCHKKSPDDFYEFCCTVWTRLQANHCCSISSLLDQHSSASTKTASCSSRSSYRVQHVTVTPLRILYHPMHTANGHRAMRHYEKNLDYKWMLVHFREEDLQQNITNIQFNDELRYRYQQILEQGLSSERNVSEALIYHYFGSSGSQVRNEAFWFLALGQNLTPERAAEKVHQARMALGDFKSIRNVATYVARVGLYLTTSKPTDVSKHIQWHV
jgi:hypothetical protein